MTGKHEANTLTDWEKAEIDRANASGLVPVVFVHGLWLLSSSWQRWRDLFEANGYITLAPGWPDDPATVEDAKAHPEVFAHKMVQGVTDHYLAAISQLQKKPAVIGHSFGGLIVQKIAGEGVAAATVAIDNAPFKGVLPLPISSLKSAFPVLGNPLNRGKAIALTFDQFKYGWANNLDDTEARELYETFHVPASGAPLFQAAVANFNPFGGETQLDSKNPQRGPEPSQRMLFETLKSVTAMFRSWPEHSTRPSRLALASKWLAASTNLTPVSLCSTSATAAPNLGCVLMPVPTAVPPAGSSSTASRARFARPSESSNCRT